MPLDISTLSIDRFSPVPLYFQIERLIAQEILGGSASSGERIPTELAIADHFKVSRSVARQAVMRLEQQGLVTRSRGHGTYVGGRQHRSWLLQGAEGFFDQERGVTSKVLRAEIVALPSWAADALSLPRRTRGVVLERLRYIDDQLTVYDLNFLPERFADVVIGLSDDPKGSLYRALAQACDLVVASGIRKLDAVIAGKQLGAILETRPSEPLIVIEAIDFDVDRQPFDCYRTWVRPDRLNLEVQVVSPTLLNLPKTGASPRQRQG
jgi:GntR family transcriptional regulator